MEKMKIKFNADEVFSDDQNSIELIKPMEFEIEQDGSPHLTRFGKLETYAKDEESLRTQLSKLLPYMWRNYIVFEDNTNGMADFLKEHMREKK